AIQRLTAAYRSRSRPSSTPGAKASTVCPSYLDGVSTASFRDAALSGRLRDRLGDTRSHRPDGRCFVGMIVQFSRSAKRRRGAGDSGASVSQNSTAWTSAQWLAPGPVDIRYRVVLELDGMPSWRSPALHVLELP